MATLLAEIMVRNFYSSLLRQRTIKQSFNFTICTYKCVPRVSPYELCDSAVGWRLQTWSYNTQHYLPPQQPKVSFCCFNTAGRKNSKFGMHKKCSRRIFECGIPGSMLRSIYLCMRNVAMVIAITHATVTTTNALHGDRWRCCHVSSHVY
jgi:hypothetical protein